MSVTKEQERAFLNDLSELTKKHGIAIWGCGCCGSPSMDKAEGDIALGRYIYESRIEWTAPGCDGWQDHESERLVEGVP